MRKSNLSTLLRAETAAVVLLAFLTGVCAFASGGEAAAEEQSIFSGTFADSLWTLIAFLLLLAILSKVAWRPLVNQLQVRQDYIKQQIETAENTKRHADNLLDQYKQQGVEIVNKLTAQAQLLEKEMIDKTGQEIAQMKRQAQADVEYARVAASQQMWQEAGGMLLSLSSKIVGRTITHEDNQRFLCEAIKKLEQERAGEAQ